MKSNSGKVGVTAIVVVAFVVGIGVMAVSSGESPSSAAARFMQGLVDMDEQTLADLSYGEGTSNEQFREKWDYTMHVVAPYFQFSYEVKDETKQGDDRAVVTLLYVRNAGSSGTYEENFQLPMIKTEDGWKVEVYSINRDMFPGLPRE